MTNRFKAPVTRGAVFMNGSAAFCANKYLSPFFASTVVGNTARGIRTLSRSTNLFMAIPFRFFGRSLATMLSNHRARTDFVECHILRPIDIRPDVRIADGGPVIKADNCGRESSRRSRTVQRPGQTVRVTVGRKLRNASCAPWHL